MDACLARRKPLSWCLSTCWLLLLTPEIFQNSGFFDGSRRPGKKEGPAPGSNDYSFLRHPFFSTSSTTSTIVERPEFQGVAYYPFFAAYASSGGGVAGRASPIEEGESYIGDGGDESPELSVSRTPRWNRGVPRGYKTSLKAPVLMLAATVVFLVMLAYTKYKLGGMKFLGGSLPATLTHISGKPSADVKDVPGFTRTKALLLGTTLILAALLVPEILRRSGTVLQAEKLLGSAVRDVKGSDWLSMTTASRVTLAALVSTLLATAILVFPRKNGDAEPLQVAQEEALSQLEEEAPRTSSQGPEDLDLKELPARLEVIHAPEVKKDGTGRFEKAEAEIVYRPGSPAVVKVVQAIPKLVAEVEPITPTLAAAMRKAVEEFEKPPGDLERLLPGASFELEVRRLISSCYRAQLVVFRYNLWRMENHFLKGLFAGHSAFLAKQVKDHRTFAQVLLVEFGRNRRSTAAIAGAIASKKKKILSFLDSEAEAFEAFVELNERRLGVITRFADEDGGVRSGLEGEAKEAFGEIDRRGLEATQKLIRALKPDLPSSLAAPWKDL
ncbi:hypothetical protein CSUI_009204 [Cystoisospora suis]|uniref:Transmembrane protein n=1 Tax=Cystoisospora suis TaxID=483139 RepID=A0A2C6KIP0_9APIC|nr:hypothetical protein CSUI_009204 [Cystoisospora suis]